MEDLKSLSDDGLSSNALKPTVIMDNIYGAFSSIALLAAMQLDVFTPLGDGGMDGKALSDYLGLQEDKLSPVLSSLAAIGLLKMEGNQYLNSDEAAAFLVKGRPEYLGELSGFYTALLEMVLKTASSVRTGQPQAKHDFHNLSEEELSAYFRKQIHSSLKAGHDISERFDFSPYSSLLDAGGGAGGVSMALCQKNPHLKATVADLPKVAGLAESFIGEAALSDRINVSPTDLCLYPPPGKYDAAIARALIQTLSREDASLCLGHISQALVPGGRIFIFGNVMDDSRTGPPSALAFSLVFLNTYDRGKAYTEKEYRQMLAEAGFTDIAIQYEALSDGLGLATAIKK